jgi:hypothetical protein
MYWIVLRESANGGGRALVGAAGFKGMPSNDGTVGDLSAPRAVDWRSLEMWLHVYRRGNV